MVDLLDALDAADAAVDVFRELIHEERSTRGRTARYARARRRLARAVGGAVRGVERGVLSPLDATARFAAAYERAALDAATGSYARARRTPDAVMFARVEAEVDTTARRFGRFMADVGADAVKFPGGPRARADLYLRRLDGFRNRTWADAVSGPGALWWWELGSGDSCRDCISLHLESPYTERPPTVPCMGGTLCQCIADLGALVTTIRGKVPISQVRVGDQVLTHRGRWRSVQHVHRRRARFELVRVGGVAASREHGWATDAGWLESPRLSVYTMSHGYLSRMWREGAERREIWKVSGVSRTLSLRGGEGRSCGAVQVSRVGQECQDPMEESHNTREDFGGGAGGGEIASCVLRRPDRGFLSRSTARRSADRILLGGRPAPMDLPLPVGLDLGARSDPCGIRRSPQERGPDGRSTREPRMSVGGGARTTSHDGEPAREKVSSVGEPCLGTPVHRVVPGEDRAAAWVLAVDRSSETRTEHIGVHISDVMDLSVEEDRSYVVGGQVSHNSSCKCKITVTTGGREPGRPAP